MVPIPPPSRFLSLMFLYCCHKILDPSPLPRPTVSYDTHIFVKKLKNLKFHFWFSAIEGVVYSPIRCLMAKQSEFPVNFLSKWRNNEQFLLEI